MSKKHKDDKKNLKKKMTEEEKEELKIIKQNKMLREQFDREQKFSILSKARGAENHQSICRSFTLERLSNELKALIPSLNHIFDKCEHDLKTIINHREHAEEHHRRLFSFEARIIDSILNLYNLFNYSMKTMYEYERDQLVADFYESNITKERIFYERKYYYENLAHVNSSLINDRLNMWNEKLINRQIDIESLSFIKREKNSQEKIERENLACDEIKSILKLFNQSLWPKQRLDDYQKVFVKEIQVNDEYEKVSKNVEKNLEIVKNLNSSLREFEYKKLARETELKSEIQFLSKLLKLSDNKLKEEEKNDKKKIINLVMIIQKTKMRISKLSDKIKKIDSLLKLASKHEKLTDFTRFQESFEEISTEKAQHEVLKSFFYKKLAQIQTDCMTLKIFKAQLIKENDNISDLISQAEHQRGLEYNYQLLKLNLKPSVGSIHQIAHEIPQVKYEIKMQNLYEQHIKFYSKIRKQ